MPLLGCGGDRVRRLPPSFLAFAGLILYTVFFYRDLLFAERVYVFRDAPIWLAMDHVARVLATFAWPPLWDPFAVLGKPFAADLLNGVYYVPHWPLRWLPEPIDFNAGIALHHVIAASGMYGLLRYRRVAVSAAALGSLVFGFGGVLISLDSVPNGLYSAAWLPWIALAFEAWCERRTTANLALLSITLSMAMLGALPEFVVFADGLLVARGVERARTGRGPLLRESITALVLANVLAAGLCAVQLVPFGEYIGRSTRLGGLKETGVLSYSLSPLGVLTFLLPRHFVDASGRFHETAGLWEGTLSRAPWMLTLYVGAVMVVSVAAYPRLSRFQRRWWGTIACLSLLLALGKNLPGYAWLVQHVVVLRMVRYPEKFLIIAHSALAVAIALGLDDARRNPRGFRRVLVGAALGAALALLARSLVGATATFPVALLRNDLDGLILMLAAITAVALAGRTYPSGACLALLALAAADLFRVNAQLLPTLPWSDVRHPSPALQVMHRGDDPLRIYSDELQRPAVATVPERFMQERNLLLMQNATFDLAANVNTPSSINLSDHERLEFLIEQTPRERTAAVLGALNVAYVTAARAVDRPGLVRLHAPVDPLDAFVYAVEPHAPRAYVPQRLRAVGSADEAAAHLAQAEDPVAEVAVDGASIPVGLPLTMSGTVRIESYLPDRVMMRAEMRTAGLVVLSDTFYGGWSATVDGKPAPIVRVNCFVRGVRVEAGTSRIVFNYKPWSYGAGALVSLLSLGLVLVLTLKQRKSRTAKVAKKNGVKNCS